MFPSLIMDTGAALTTDKCQGISVSGEWSPW